VLRRPDDPGRRSDQVGITRQIGESIQGNTFTAL